MLKRLITIAFLLTITGFAASFLKQTFASVQVGATNAWFEALSRENRTRKNPKHVENMIGSRATTIKGKIRRINFMSITDRP